MDLLLSFDENCGYVYYSKILYAITTVSYFPHGVRCSKICVIALSFRLKEDIRRTHFVDDFFHLSSCTCMMKRIN
jgi:hypothetical protein